MQKKKKKKQKPVLGTLRRHIPDDVRVEIGAADRWRTPRQGTAGRCGFDSRRSRKRSRIGRHLFDVVYFICRQSLPPRSHRLRNNDVNFPEHFFFFFFERGKFFP